MLILRWFQFRLIKTFIIHTAEDLSQQYNSNTVSQYRKNSKYWDIYVWANSVDSDQTAPKEQCDQDLHCLPFFLHLLEALLQCKIKLFYIKDN